MIFFFCLLFTPFQSTGLVIAPSLSITKTTGTAELASQVTTPEAEAGPQVTISQHMLATCGETGNDRASPLKCPSTNPYTLTDSGGSWKCCNEIGYEGNCKTYFGYGDDICGVHGKEDCDSQYTVLACPSDTPSCVRHAQSSGLGTSSTIYSLRCENAHEKISTMNTGPSRISIIQRLVDAIQEMTTGSSQTETKFSIKQKRSSGSARTSANSGTTNSDSGSSKFGAAEIIAIVIPSVGVIITIVVTWWEPTQVLYFCTCHKYGRRERKRTLWTRLKLLGNKLRFWRRS